MKKSKLAIVTTHPIQYNAPLFRLLSIRGNVNIKVFYTWSQSAKGAKYDPGFGKTVDWDIPLLEGYEYSFVENISTDPGTHHFKGVVNPTLVSEIEAWHPDAVLVFGWSFKSHLQCLRHFYKKIPVLFRGDSTLMDETPGIKQWVRRVFLKWVYRFVNTAFYVGTQNKWYYLRHGLKEDQLVFAPHAIDNERFFDKNSEYEEKSLRWKTELGISEEGLTFLYAGKLETKKAPESLINAFKSLHLSDAHLILVGNGVLEKELKAKYKDLSSLHFIDFQNQSVMPVIYRLGNVFVLPSSGPGETWGLGVNEAMASGRAVLVSHKCGCAVDLIDEGKNGYSFKAGDPVDLPNKMRTFTQREVNVAAMGEFSAEKIKNWNFNATAAAIESVVVR